MEKTFILLAIIALGIFAHVKKGSYEQNAMTSTIQAKFEGEPVTVKFKSSDKQEAYFCDKDKNMVINIESSRWKSITEPSAVKEFIAEGSQVCFNQ